MILKNLVGTIGYVLGVVVILGLVLLMPITTPAKMEAFNPDTKLGRSVIVMHETMYMSDFVEFMRLTSNHRIKHYTILIHSPGGNAITCIAITNRIRELQKRGVTFTTKLYGCGMSAGSFIFMLGNERIVYEDATLMFHTTRAQMSEFEWANMPPVLRTTMERWDNRFRSILKKLTGMSDKSVAYWMDGGKAQFMSAKTAYNVGIATKYIPAD